MEKLARLLEIPEDIAFDLPKITLIGNLQVLIENHRGIIEYSSKKIRISVNLGELEVTGENLAIRNITRDEIYLDGDISALKYHH